MSIGCDKIIPPNMTTTSTRLVLADFYLGFCDDFNVGEKQVELEVTVEGTDGQGGIVQIEQEYIATLNDDTDPDNLIFEIDCPIDGSYRVDVRVVVACASCCDPSGFNVCNFDEDGRARFRETSMFLNCLQPVDVYIRPLFQTCTNCNC